MERDCREGLDGLVAQLAACADGVGQLALVSGGLASGKTHLLHAFARRVKDSGALHLSATGTRDAADFPAGCAVLDQLFRNPDLPPGVAERVGALLADAPADPEHADASRVVHALCVELLELARARPLVVSVDDVQFVDPLSLRLLLRLRRRIASARVMVVLTEWSWPHPAMTRFHAEITQHPHRRLRLAPLTEAAVAELAAAHAATAPGDPGAAPGPGAAPKAADGVAGEAPGAARHAALVRLGGGNPLLVHGLLEDSRTLPPGAPLPGPAYGQAVLNCLYRWDAALLTVAQGLAVLGGDAASPGVVGALVSLPEDAVRRVVDALAAAGVLDGARFRHPLAERAVLGTLAPGARARLHAAAAELLHQRGCAPEAVARQLVAGRDAGPAGAWVTGVLRAAAARAAAQDDTAAVTECLETALDACADPAEADAVRRELARAVWRADPARADRLLAPDRAELATGAPPPATGPTRHTGPTAASPARAPEAARTALALLRQALWQGDEDTAHRARARYAELAAVDEACRDRYAEAELLLAERWFHGGAGSPRDTRPPGGADPDREDPWVRAVRTVAESSAGANAKLAVPSAEHIVESCRLEDTLLEVVLAALLTLVRGNQAQRARERAERLYREAVRRRAPVWQAVLGAVRADVALRHGELGAAADGARSALALLPPGGWGVLRWYPLGTLASALTAAGDLTGAEEALRPLASGREPGLSTAWGLRCLYARGQFQLASDRVLAAVRDFQTCGRLAEEARLDSAEFVPWRNGLAEADLRLGRTVLVRDLVRQQLAQARGVSLRTQGVSLRLLAAVSDLTQRPGLLRKSVSALEAAGDRLELSRSLTDLSVACRGVGELEEARAVAWRATQERKLCRLVPAPVAPGAARGPVRAEPPAPVPAAAGRTAAHGSGPDADVGTGTGAGTGPALGAGTGTGVGSHAGAGAGTGFGTAPLAVSAEPAGGALAEVPGQGAERGAGQPLLSDAESRVALLAARGYSNRDISRQLFITVSTVEQHLTRVYRKLGVSTRRALPTRLLAP